MMDERLQSCDRMCRYCNNSYHKCPESKSFQSTDFLLSTSELKKNLESFASSIQEVVNLKL